MRPVRVGANLLWLVPGVVGGSEEYSVRLLEALARLPRDEVAVTLFVNRELQVAHPDLADAFPTVVGPLTGASRAVRVAAEATWLARQARAEGLDLVHHLGGTMPVVRSTPGLVTIHDLQPFAFPDNFSRVKRAYLRTTVPTSVRRAVAVIALTDFIRSDVVARLDVDPDRILLVPPGIDPPLPIDPTVAKATRARLGLGDAPYFLYPAITYAHKNHVTLVRAFARVAAADDRPMLVLTGGPAEAEELLRDEIAELGLGDRVVRTGRIDRSELDALFAEARALTFPSLYEGFGLPVLEAMNRGLPVIASSIAALPEVVGDAGVLVEPTDVDGWADAMSQLLDDDDRRAALAHAGSRRAAEFTWDASGRALTRAYLQAWSWSAGPPVSPELGPGVAS